MSRPRRSREPAGKPPLKARETTAPPPSEAPAEPSAPETSPEAAAASAPVEATPAAPAAEEDTLDIRSLFEAMESLEEGELPIEGGERPETGQATGTAEASPERDEISLDDTLSIADPEADAPGDPIEEARDLTQEHLHGLVEALVFAADKPMTAGEIARMASAPIRQVRATLAELKQHYLRRGIILDEVAGGWLFRTSVQYAPFVRELSSERPVKLTRAQVETLAIAAYRQPITRPEIDEIRGVDSGATLKLLLERDLVRILGKKDEPGRPLLYGTTTHFLEFFGLKSLKDLPTLREFTELSDESRRVAEAELGEVLGTAASAATPPPTNPTPVDEPTVAGEVGTIHEGASSAGDERAALDERHDTADERDELADAPLTRDDHAPLARHGHAPLPRDGDDPLARDGDDEARSPSDAPATHDTMIPSAPPTGDIDDPDAD